MTKFCRVELRTTDAEAARAFYASVLDHERAVIWPLHEQALARGARPHWLGSLGVADPDAAAARFIERGAMALGPVRPGPDGGRMAVLRDPGGAIIALSDRPADPTALSAVEHVLNTNDAARATRNYCELFGWVTTGQLDLGGLGTFEELAFEPGGATAVIVGDVAARPGVHPHWLFLFEVSSLEHALAAVRTGGGMALAPLTLPSGLRVGVCDDPQGAAFGLMERGSLEQPARDAGTRRSGS
jgi:uncharacterized protein